MARRFTLPITEVQNSSGAVGGGWKLEFFITGTSTPLDNYSDNALATANDNPIVADSGGRFGNIFLKDAEYKVTLSDANDVQIWSADPVHGGDSTDLVTATGAQIGRSLANHFADVFNLLNYAKGDGVTDDTTAIQEAIDDASTAGGGKIFGPQGTFLIGKLTMKSNTVFCGSGVDVTIFKIKDSTNDNGLVFPTGGTNLVLRDFTLDGNKANQTAGNGILITNCDEIVIETVKVKDAFTHGILFDDASDTDGTHRSIIKNNIIEAPGKHGIVIDRSDFVVIQGNIIKNAGTAGIQNFLSDQVSIIGNVIEHDGTGGQHVGGAGGIRITASSESALFNSVVGNTIRKMSRGLFIGANVQFSTFIGNVIEEPGRDGILLSDCKNNTVVGNTIRNPGQEGAAVSKNGITLQGAQNNVISSNRIIEDQGTPTMVWAISEETTSTKNIFSDNRYAKGTSGTVTFVDQNSAFPGNLGDDHFDDIASATTITLPVSGDGFNVTGTTTIATINGGWRGRVVVLRFGSTATITASSTIKLAGATDFDPTADDTLTLMFLASAWYEVTNSVN